MLDELEKATTAWQETYEKPHVRIDRNEPEPFHAGKWLGGGGSGDVYKTNLGGVALALKRIYTDNVKEAVLTEVKIMQDLTKDRHHHIVQLIGSYEKRISGTRYELGLLIWPVACCDLSALLLDVDSLGSWIVDTAGSTLQPTPQDDEEDVLCAIETLLKLDPHSIAETDAEAVLSSTAACKQLYDQVLCRLGKSIGCIAQAVKWLHDRRIQHKDLKPSQILVSSQGLWLGDFGWSKNMSDSACSTTAEGKTTTPKYLAPERKSKLPCGQPQDIFSLGCIFLEIGYQLARPHYLETSKKTRAPWFAKDWCFSDNIEQARTQATFLKTRQLNRLGAIIWNMLDSDSRCRQSIDQIVASLALDNKNMIMGPCCTVFQGLQLQDSLSMDRLKETSTATDTSCRDITSIQVDLPNPARPTYLLPPSNERTLTLADEDYEFKRARYNSPERLQFQVRTSEVEPIQTIDQPCGLDATPVSIQDPPSLLYEDPTKDLWTSGPYDWLCNDILPTVYESAPQQSPNFSTQTEHHDWNTFAPYEGSPWLSLEYNVSGPAVPGEYLTWTDSPIAVTTGPVDSALQSRVEENNTVHAPSPYFADSLDASGWERLWSTTDTTDFGLAHDLTSSHYAAPCMRERSYLHIQPRPLCSAQPVPVEDVPETLKCEDCDLTLHGKYRRGNLARHRRRMHMQGEARSFACKFCKKTYQRSDALRVHMIRAHQEGSPRMPRTMSQRTSSSAIVSDQATRDWYATPSVLMGAETGASSATTPQPNNT